MSRENASGTFGELDGDRRGVAEDGAGQLQNAILSQHRGERSAESFGSASFAGEWVDDGEDEALGVRRACGGS